MFFVHCVSSQSVFVSRARLYSLWSELGVGDVLRVILLLRVTPTISHSLISGTDSGAVT